MWHKFQECWCGYSAAAAAAAGEGLTGEVDAPQPPRLLWARAAGKQERGWWWGGGDFPAVRAAPELDRISHNAQKTGSPHTSFPQTASVCSLLPFCVLFPIPFLPPPHPSLLPAFWRYTHTLSGACSSWPLLLRHFLWRLCRPTFGPINAAFLPFFPVI